MPQYLRDIKDELKDFPRNPNKYPRLRIRSLESKPGFGKKTLMYRAVVMGETANYTTSVQFFDVEYNAVKDSSFSIPIKVEKNLMYHAAPSVRKNKVLLKCSCPDFRFRWEKPLYDNKALIGTYRKYVRKTPPPPVGHPYANPEDLQGYCKHVNSLLLSLKDSGFIKP